MARPVTSRKCSPATSQLLVDSDGALTPGPPFVPSSNLVSLRDELFVLIHPITLEHASGAAIRCDSVAPILEIRPVEGAAKQDADVAILLADVAAVTRPGVQQTGSITVHNSDLELVGLVPDAQSFLTNLTAGGQQWWLAE